MNQLHNNRVVIKIWTSTITDKWKINHKWIGNLAKIVYFLQKSDFHTVLVSSWAVWAWRDEIDISKIPWIDEFDEIQKKQLLAMIWQPKLMAAYKEQFSKRNLLVWQWLVEKSHFDPIEREKKENMLWPLDIIFKISEIIPIFNENDFTASQELRFWDNDNLASYVAELIKARCLIILSDVDWLYTWNPNIEENVKLVKEVFEIDDYIEWLWGWAINKCGSWWMITKIEAAKYATKHWIDTIITHWQKLFRIIEILHKHYKFQYDKSLLKELFNISEIWKAWNHTIFYGKK